MRLLGRYQVPGCCPGTRAGRNPGPDCSGGGPLGRRLAKARERRALDREFALWSDWYDTDEGRLWLNGPLLDVSDCMHGCNGDCVESGSTNCDFTCHDAPPPA